MKDVILNFYSVNNQIKTDILVTISFHLLKLFWAVHLWSNIVKLQTSLKSEFVSLKFFRASLEKSRDSGISVSWVIILSFVCDNNYQLNYPPNVLCKANKLRHESRYWYLEICCFNSVEINRIKCLNLLKSVSIIT